MKKQLPLIDRELSWLAFNHRVLQEAADLSVPLRERLNFIAIFSSNLDEFYRVRVAGLRSLAAQPSKKLKKLPIDPSELLARIHAEVHRQQEQLGGILRDVLSGLARNGLRLLKPHEVSPEQRAWLQSTLLSKVKQFVRIQIADDDSGEFFLENRALYLVAVTQEDADDTTGTGKQGSTAFLRLPVDDLGRFIELPAGETGRDVIFLDDVLRLFIDELLPDFETERCYAVKLNRDAELYIDDEYSGDLVKKIKKALRNRDSGVPARFLHDPQLPVWLRGRLKVLCGLDEEDLVSGGHYHNLHDFFSFPNTDRADDRYPKLEPLPHIPFEMGESMFDVIRERDHLLHFPYQSYAYVTGLLEQAAEDPAVTSIAITIYRLAGDSRIASSLMKAAKSGKSVSVFLEIKARFDEEANLLWLERLTDAGAQVRHSMPGLKVHAKLLCISRSDPDGERLYAYLGTGNFNEKTAGIYCDSGLFTSSEEITREVAAVFALLHGSIEEYDFQRLLVSRHNMRDEINALIQHEIDAAERGDACGIMMKMNSLEDPRIIDRLYRASRAGVPVRLLIRGICCLETGREEWSDNIVATSIVDRYLEHTRAYVFHHGGEQRCYLASADMMRRNLNRRIEVAFPIHEAELKQKLLAMLDLQARDNTKSRILDAGMRNPYMRNGEASIRAQRDVPQLLRDDVKETSAVNHGEVRTS